MGTIKNTAVKVEMMLTGVTIHDLARRLGVSESTMFRWLRDELPENDRQGYIKIIRQIAKEKTAEHATAQD